VCETSSASELKYARRCFFTDSSSSAAAAASTTTTATSSAAAAVVAASIEDAEIVHAQIHQIIHRIVETNPMAPHKLLAPLVHQFPSKQKNAVVSRAVCLCATRTTCCVVGRHRSLSWTWRHTHTVLLLKCATASNN